MNELYRYLTFAVTPEWRRLPEPVRRAHKRELALVVSASDVRVHAYSLVGTRSDAELLLWAVDEDFERLRALEVRPAATAPSGHSTRPYAYLAARRRSQYLAATSTRARSRCAVLPVPSGTSPTSCSTRW